MKQTDLFAPFLLREAEERAELNAMAQDAERALARHGIYLNTDDFNALHDFISDIVERIRENGE